MSPPLCSVGVCCLHIPGYLLRWDRLLIIITARIVSGSTTSRSQGNQLVISSRQALTADPCRTLFQAVGWILPISHDYEN